MTISLNIRLFCAIAFLILQNNHFGWNAFPHSDLEIVCDGINLLLISLVAKS